MIVFGKSREACHGVTGGRGTDIGVTARRNEYPSEPSSFWTVQRQGACKGNP